MRQVFVSFLVGCALFFLPPSPTLAGELFLDNDRYYRLLDKGVPELPLRKALAELERGDRSYPNQDYMVIIDFRMASTRKRLFLVNLQTDSVEKMFVAHGKNSGFNFATDFSNVNGSNKSSIGAYKTAEIYYGRHGKSMRLDGLDSTNSNARSRAIVLHGANYVSQDFIDEYGRLGRSLGCPAVESNLSSGLIDKIHSGALLYIYYNQ